MPANLWVSEITDPTVGRLNGLDFAEFIVKRDGDLTQSLSFNLDVSDSEWYAKGYRFSVGDLLVLNGVSFSPNQEEVAIRLRVPVAVLPYPFAEEQLNVGIVPSEGHSTSSPSSATLTIEGIEALDAVDDNVQVAPGSTAVVPVIANDTGGSGNTQISQISTPAHGMATLDGTNIKYTPDTNFIGSDSLTYTAIDSIGQTDTATVYFSVGDGTGSTLVAVNDVVTMTVGEVIAIGVLANDTAGARLLSATTPSHGTAILDDDTIIFTPPEAYLGNVSFSYTTEDGNGYYASALVHIEVSDGDLPGVSVEAIVPDADEAGPGIGIYRFTRTGSVDQDLPVFFRLEGTASPDVDYVPLFDEIVIPAGSASVDVALEAIDDLLLEGDETAVVILHRSSTYRIVGTGQATGTIHDDADTLPVVSAETVVPIAYEGGSAGQIRFRRTGDTSESLTATFTVTGDATPGTDYQALTGTVFFAPGIVEVLVNVFAFTDEEPDDMEFLFVAVSPSSATPALYAAASGGASVLIRNQEAAPHILQVTPQATDFQQGFAGRVLFSKDHDKVYRTTALTAAGGVFGKPAQTEDGKVTITAYVSHTDVTVYFEVVDPDDPTRFSNKPNVVSNLEDSFATTPYDLTKVDHAIENPGPDDRQNDNRDPNKSIDNPLVTYRRMQQNALSARSAVSKLVFIANRPAFVAEVTLNLTDRFAGDNYMVRATLTDPNGKAFNTASLGLQNDLFYIPGSRDAQIPTAAIKQTTLLTAWRRVYYELDTMYRSGSVLTADAAAAQNKVKVADVAPFAVNGKVRVISTKGFSAKLTITAINEATKELTLDGNLTREYKQAEQGFVGVEAANDATTYYFPDASRLAETFDDTYTEVQLLASGSNPLPHTANLNLDQQEVLDAFYENWFANKGKANYFQLVGADKRLNLPGDKGATSWQYKISFLFVGSHGMNEVLPRTTNHEIGHLFQDSALPNGGHTLFRAHDDSDLDLMQDGGNARESNFVEFSLDYIYFIRDKKKL